MNPFRTNIVSTPWEKTGVDVPEIQQHVLDHCLRGIQHVRETQRSAGLLINGEAGGGKTHLLRRLRERLAPPETSATDRAECLYVWVRLQTSAPMIWRTVRRALVDDWFRGPQSGRQFDRILYHRLAKSRVAEGDVGPWLDYMIAERTSELNALIDQVAEEEELTLNLTTAFRHLVYGRHRGTIRAWLRGESLTESQLHEMNMANDELFDEEPEEESALVVERLARLAGHQLPVVLSFDQIEALQTMPGDVEGLIAFGNLVSRLHDRTSNMLMISSIQSSFAETLTSAIRGADKDRVASLGRYSIEPLTAEQAAKIIEARLKAAAPVALRPKEAPPSWPLQPSELSDLASVNLSPRTLLTRCAEAYESLLTGTNPIPVVVPPQPSPPEPDTSIQDRVEREETHRRSISVPANTDTILSQGLPLLANIVAPDVKPIRADKADIVNLIFSRDGKKTGVAFSIQPNMTSVAGHLAKLVNVAEKKKFHSLIVIRDSRVPLTRGAAKARERMEALAKTNAVILHPSVEVLAAIDALRAVLSDAKSGDFSDSRGRQIGEATVANWIRSHLEPSVREFVETVLGEPPAAKQPPPIPVEKIAELLGKEPIVSLEQAANVSGFRVEDIVAAGRLRPDVIGVLPDPDGIVFKPAYDDASTGV